MTAIFVGAGGQLQPDLYVDAARPAVLVGAAVLFAAMIVAFWLPSGRGVSAGAVAGGAEAGAGAGSSESDAAAEASAPPAVDRAGA